MTEDTNSREGGCHCGHIRYRTETPDPLRGGRCNCSICAMKGVVMVYVPLAAVEVTKGEDTLACYRFNTRVAKHYFCPNCGIHLFHQARSAPDMYGVNAATLDDVCPYADFPDVAVNYGVHHQKDHGGRVRMAGRLIYSPTVVDE